MSSKKNSILVIDDRIDIRLSLVLLLEDHGYTVFEAENPQVAQMMLKNHIIDLALLDMNFTLDTTSGEEGLNFLTWFQTSNMNLPIIAMTAWSNVDLVVKAMKLGVSDFIEKPWKNRQLLHIVEQQLSLTSLQQQNAKLKQQLINKPNKAISYQWRSPCMINLLQQIKTVANTDVNILLTGDNGTGKSDLAFYIHQHSMRKSDSLISVNMGAIAENLFESEMFGHTKGAFTDAKESRIGRFELADNGSLFLDEIANIPLSQQAKLLRVLETGEFEVLGSSKTIQSNIRLISATNGKISSLIHDDKFREDLYYRLNTLEFNLPSLAQRIDDIVPLAQFFIDKFVTKYNLENCLLVDEAQSALLAYHWPGNIRELSHLIERAVLLCKHRKITVDDLPLRTSIKQPSVKNQLNPANQEIVEDDKFPFMTLEKAELNLIKQALLKTNDNIPQAAILLGLTKSSMYRRLEKHDLSV
ncbi:sigma-54-dependent transcriptional regulator [Colwellia psychrerythraea]|uniref:Two component, sigma54 specific, transcriptional regulator, Fis family n=1 Tax=Colwellia psychrerythraea TaxID=28229 RepID=A0A099KSG8_COLPS|nr:sigma-54 dependent transcriptional regulator [Colwellia psychrerythraea]KGJ92832.1 two component, sigma54 specific, transcriptional regulator, Fis family [Colwellia psychrerythraea]